MKSPAWMSVSWTTLEGAAEGQRKLPHLVGPARIGGAVARKDKGATASAPAPACRKRRRPVSTTASTGLPVCSRCIRAALRPRSPAPRNRIRIRAEDIDPTTHTAGR
ncbi:MAG: hypothetical protein MZV70_51445 [Desulfobacterales bacterium]|nr:hypothetical protein [Desulfobacterales bacterium]